MKLLSAHVHGFGNLKDYKVDFTDGKNVIFEKNGTGKSTLATFIKVMFFGFQEKLTTKTERTDKRKKYKPWSGDLYGGELVFETSGKTYLMIRTFGKDEKEDTLKLFDNLTKLESKDFIEEKGQGKEKEKTIGSELFQIDVNSFFRTIYISQSDVDITVTDTITAKMGNLVEDLTDVNQFEKVMEEFKNVKNSMSPTRKTGEIAKLKLEIKAKEKEIKKNNEIDDEIALLEKEIEALESKKVKNISEQKAEQENINKSIQKSSEADAIAAKKTHYKKLCEDYENALKEYNLNKSFFKGEVPSKEEISELLAQIDKNENEKKELEKRRLSLSESEALEKAKDTHGKRDYSVLIAIILFIAGVVFLAIKPFVSIPFFLVAIVVLVVSINKKKKSDEYMLLFNKQKKFVEEESLINGEDDQIRAKISRMITNEHGEMSGDLARQLYSIDNHRQNCDRTIKALEKAKTAKEDFEKDDDVSKLQETLGKEAPNQEAPNQENLSRENPNQEELSQQALAGKQALADRLDELRKEATSLDEIIRASQYKLNERQETKKTRDELIDEVVKLSETLEYKIKRYEIIKKTSEILPEARNLFAVKYTKPLKDAFDKYYKMLTGSVIDGDAGGDADGNAKDGINADSKEFIIDTNFDLKVKELGDIREKKALSAGYSDLVNICMRMSIVDAMYKNEKPFVIFDDPFVNLDNENLRGAIKLLDEISKEYQVIYFTCHDSRI